MLLSPRQLAVCGPGRYGVVGVLSASPPAPSAQDAAPPMLQSLPGIPLTLTDDGDGGGNSGSKKVQIPVAVLPLHGVDLCALLDTKVAVHGARLVVMEIGVRVLVVETRDCVSVVSTTPAAPQPARTLVDARRQCACSHTPAAVLADATLVCTCAAVVADVVRQAREARAVVGTVSRVTAAATGGSFALTLAAPSSDVGTWLSTATADVVVPPGALCEVWVDAPTLHRLSQLVTPGDEVLVAGVDVRCSDDADDRVELHVGASGWLLPTSMLWCPYAHTATAALPSYPARLARRSTGVDTAAVEADTIALMQQCCSRLTPPPTVWHDDGPRRSADSDCSVAKRARTVDVASALLQLDVPPLSVTYTGTVSRVGDVFVELDDEPRCTIWFVGVDREWQARVPAWCHVGAGVRCHNVAPVVIQGAVVGYVVSRSSTVKGAREEADAMALLDPRVPFPLTCMCATSCAWSAACDRCRWSACPGRTTWTACRIRRTRPPVRALGRR